MLCRIISGRALFEMKIRYMQPEVGNSFRWEEYLIRYWTRSHKSPRVFSIIQINILT